MESQKTYEFQIEGIDCLDCVTRIKDVLQHQSRIREVSLSLETGKLNVRVDSDFDPLLVVKEMNSLGYRVKGKHEGIKTVLLVEGMDCEDEIRLIEKKLKGLHGIISHRVNLIRGTLEVVYQPSLISQKDIIRAVGETGLKPRVEAREEEAAKPWWYDKKVLFLAGCGMVTLVAFILHRLGLPERITSFVYLTGIALGIYYPARIGLVSLKTFTLNIYTLLVVALAGALGLALWEEAAVLVFVYSLGALLETYSTNKARRAIVALIQLAPKKALIKRGGTELQLPVEEVKIDDTMIIKPGEKVPLDGIATAGYSSVDESPLTGESIPVEKKRGDEVFAGSINKTGSLEVRVTKASTDTTLAKIIHSVEEAQARKSRYQRFGERFGKYYTPLTFGLAILTAVIPPLVFGEPFSVWFYRTLVLLVVSCSCGLALSVPVAVISAISNAARHGILIKGGAYLEAASGLEVIAFDKTGTLTLGNPKLCDIVSLDDKNKKDLLRLAASLEARSEHPLAEAILREAKENGLALYHVEDFEAVPGKGVRAKIGNHPYFIGSEKLFPRAALSEELKEKIEVLQGEGKTTVMVGTESEIIGILAVMDQVRIQAKETIDRLKRSGYRIVMLTGDNRLTAKAVAQKLGIDEYKESLLPDDKKKIVEELKKTYGKVAFAGDGINDAPAMAGADIGIAMGACGTDVAIETGDIVLMSDDLLKIPFVLNLSKRSIKNIKQNIIASLSIVALLVPSALFGLVGLIPGLLINELSALIVISNGLRLLR